MPFCAHVYSQALLTATLQTIVGAATTKLIRCSSTAIHCWQVVVLRSLRSKLAEAQAQIHTTAAALHLREGQQSHGEHDAFVGLNEREHLFLQACRGVTRTCNSCSEVSCLPGLRHVYQYQQMPAAHEQSIAYFSHHAKLLRMLVNLQTCSRTELS